MATKKYINLDNLSTFLDALKTTFSEIGHKHTVSDITDYTVDSTLSSTSTNPVQNKVIDAEFEAISNAMGALETAIDGKADSGHTHDDRYYTESEIDSRINNINEFISTIVNGPTEVAKSKHATNADSATKSITATSATKATQDASGNVITSTYETKTDAASKLSEAKTYADSVGATIATGKQDKLTFDTEPTADSANPVTSGGVYDALEAMKDNVVGENVEGKQYFLEDGAHTAAVGAEIFNNYEANVAVGEYSHAEGIGTTASGNCSHAEGAYATASGEAAHAEGENTIASGYASHAEGYSTRASSDYQHVEGKYNIEDTESTYIHIVGNGETKNTRSNAHTLDWSGNAWFAGDVYVGGTSKDDGGVKLVKESDLSCVANLVDGAGTGSLAGVGAEEATGMCSVAIGCGTSAINEGAFAEGSRTTASGIYSHAEGDHAIASGTASHAEGQSAESYGVASHAEGFCTKASSDYQHVQGKYNIEDTAEKYAHIVGNGDSSSRSNAHTIDWDGNAWFAGDVYVGSTSGTNKDEGSKIIATQEYVDIRVPAWTADDEGKFLRIVNGVPTWATINIAEEASF